MRTLRTAHALWLLAAICFVALIPLFLVTIPAMVDYPNHLARCYILAQLPNSEALASLYEPRQALLPNLAMDAIVVPLAQHFPIFTAGRIFCGLILVVMLSGAVAFSQSLFGRITLWSFAPALLLFNRIYSFGFLNYLLGLGLLLWGLAGWIWLREKHWTLRLIVGATTVSVLFLCHMIALFLFGCAVVGYEIARWSEQNPRRFRDALASALQVGVCFVPALILLKQSPTASEASRYNPAPLWWKWEQFIQMLRIDATRLDQIFTGVVFGAVLTLFIAGALRMSRRSFGVWVGAVAGFMALPAAFNTVGCVDLRVPVFVGLVTLAGAQVVKWDRIAQVGTAALAIAFGIRIAQVSDTWVRSDRELQTVLRDFDHVSPNSVIFSATERTVPLYTARGWSPPLIHAPLLAVMNKPALVPQIFALPTQHPLAVREEFRTLQNFQNTFPFAFVGTHVDPVMEKLREMAARPDVIPPTLAADTPFYVFAITGPYRPPLETLNAVAVVQRPDYTIYRLTNLEQAAIERQQYWAQREPARVAELLRTLSAPFVRMP